MNAQSPGGGGASGNPHNLARSYEIARKPLYRDLWTASREFARSFLLLVSTFALAVSVGGCGFIHLNPDSELAPSDKAENVWKPPPSTETLNRPFTNLEQLRASQERGDLQSSGKQTYDLPALVDLALRLSPQTRHAWYVALEYEGQLGRSQANNYPMVGAESEGGYFKLPLEFPGQTLKIENWAAVPQFKVSYDLLDFGR
ncbi:MAG TPA: hypothetical protein VMU16_02900, partial [Candidatus Binataceae bacterium]|nr:hypothetical protein [Candidatus Binataceae bacterium]